MVEVRGVRVKEGGRKGCVCVCVCMCACVLTCNSSSVRWAAQEAANVTVQVPHEQEHLHSAMDLHLHILRGHRKERHEES
jgi:hypothetical protein